MLDRTLDGTLGRMDALADGEAEGEIETAWISLERCTCA